MDRYTVYGDLGTRETIALTTILVAKGLRVAFVPQTPSLAMALAARAGSDSGPYLRTPEGFVVADLHSMLDWIERAHPQPSLMPTTPVRRTCARILEDWLESWLPRWPRRSWAPLERLGVHLEASGFLLGDSPRRPDWLLAAWLETEVLVHDHARTHLARHAPRLTTLGEELLESVPTASQDDVVPISLLTVLGEIGRDYHAYLARNHDALKEGSNRVMLDLGLGRRALPVQRSCEWRRIEIELELKTLEGASRVDVRRVLEPAGVWHALTLPAAISDVDASDPRSL
jgi:glutathione S-transferase